MGRLPFSLLSRLVWVYPPPNFRVESRRGFYFASAEQGFPLVTCSILFAASNIAHDLHTYTTRAQHTLHSTQTIIHTDPFSAPEPLSSLIIIRPAFVNISYLAGACLGALGGGALGGLRARGVVFIALDSCFNDDQEPSAYLHSSLFSDVINRLITFAAHVLEPLIVAMRVATDRIPFETCHRSWMTCLVVPFS